MKFKDEIVPYAELDEDRWNELMEEVQKLHDKVVGEAGK